MHGPSKEFYQLYLWSQKYFLLGKNKVSNCTSNYIIHSRTRAKIHCKREKYEFIRSRKGGILFISNDNDNVLMTGICYRSFQTWITLKLLHLKAIVCF